MTFLLALARILSSGTWDDGWGDPLDFTCYSPDVPRKFVHLTATLVCGVFCEFSACVKIL